MTPSTMTERAKILSIIQEFLAFRRPDGFCGGRFQTSIPYYFAHIDQNGRLMKIEVSKPGGSIYFLKP